MSGAFPITTASMSCHVSSASASARSAASRRRPGIDSSLRAAVWCVCPIPITPQSSAIPQPSSTQTRFCCRHGPEVAWATARLRASFGDRARGFADPREARRHDRVRRERAARRVHLHVLAEPERALDQQLLVREGPVDLGDVDPSLPDARLLRRHLRRPRAREIAHAELLRLGDVREPRDPRRLLAHLPRHVARRDHHRGRRRPRSASSRAAGAATRGRARRGSSRPRSRRRPARTGCSWRCGDRGPPPRPSAARSRCPRRGRAAPGARRCSPCPARAASTCRDRAAAPAPRGDRPSTASRSRTPARCRRSPSGSSPTPRRAPTRRRPRRGTPRSAAMRPPSRGRRRTRRSGRRGSRCCPSR